LGHGETGLEDAGRNVLPPGYPVMYFFLPARVTSDREEQRNMQTSNAKQNLGPADQVWVLLFELPSIDFLPDQDRQEGSSYRPLFQMLQELGMPPECIENIGRTVAGCAKEAAMRIQQGRQEFPGQTRIFCQKKKIDDANVAKNTPKLDMQQKQIFTNPRASRIGGWGYFMIERGENLSSSSIGSQSYIDLYLYKEGE
jgi:hypothetical protein